MKLRFWLSLQLHVLLNVSQLSVGHHLGSHSQPELPCSPVAVSGVYLLLSRRVLWREGEVEIPVVLPVARVAERVVAVNEAQRISAHHRVHRDVHLNTDKVKR